MGHLIKDPCRTEGCAERGNFRGWCQTHYQIWKRGATIDDPYAGGLPGCSVENCRKVNWAHGLCNPHHQRWYLTGDVRPDDPLVVPKTQTTLHQMTESESGWLAGWLEGEGWFGHAWKRPRSLSIRAKSVDEDVIDYVISMTGVGRKWGEQPNNPNAQYCFQWRVEVKVDVMAVLQVILPIMQKRRSGRIIDLISGANWWQDFPEDFATRYRPKELAI